MIVIIDTNILGLLCNSNPKQTPERVECLNWFFSLPMRSKTPVSSDICEYELRRNLVQESLKGNAISIGSLKLLDELHQDSILEFLAVSRDVLIEAAMIWADLRMKGQPTATDQNLDADCIIGAHYCLLKNEQPGQDIAIATTNIKHLSRFSEARNWREI